MESLVEKAVRETQGFIEANLETREAAIQIPENLKSVVRYSLSRDGLLRRNEEIVTISRCFPWSEPLQWLSIRGIEEKELDLIEDANLLDPESALAIRQAIGEAAFVMKVARILSVEEQFELRRWEIELEGSDLLSSELTAGGAGEADTQSSLLSSRWNEAAPVKRLFQTKLNAWPRELPGGGVLIQDVANDFYLVEDFAKLDAKSQKILMSFLD